MTGGSGSGTTVPPLSTVSLIFCTVELKVVTNSYVTQQASKWVVEGGVEKDWDDYKATLKKMGIDDFMKIQQDAYDRYQKEVK